MNLSPLGIKKDFFIDTTGRRIILRGVNLGGDCKVPVPDGGTHIPTDFSSHKTVSFIGRPFPLNEADEHFTRLKSWGFNALRLLTTWEAIEHAGPGIYDTAYLDYFTEICRRAGEFGMYIFIDFHQDAWSRMSGGDGAPCWTLEKAGIDYRNISAAGAARVMQHDYDYSDPRPRQEDNYPTMCWSNNYRFAANAIMWTLFFAGNDFAPQLRVNGKNIQDYLQEHYCACQREVARRVMHLPNVLGFDTLNEPGCGWIGVPMDKRFTDKSDYLTMPGIALSPIDCLHASHGNTVVAPELAVSFLRGGIVQKRRVVINKDRVSLWLPGHNDPFIDAGAWEPGPDATYRILHNDFFQKVGGRTVTFEKDYFVPFAHRVTDSMRSIKKDWLLFANVDAQRYYYETTLPAGLPEGTVNASHWYDGLTLITKKFHYPITVDGVRRRPVFGKNGIKKMFESQLARYKKDSQGLNGGVPTLIGEFGIPFDLSGGRAYRAWAEGKRSANIWKEHIAALNFIYNALDTHLLHGTQWVYTASNRNDLRIGDTWNQEDFSIFSRDQQDNPADPNSGGRACEGFVRPFARRTQGTPLSMNFNRKRGIFTFIFEADITIGEPTELFVPRIQYPHGFKITAEGCDVRHDPENQLVHVTASQDGMVKICIIRHSRTGGNTDADR